MLERVKQHEAAAREKDRQERQRMAWLQRRTPEDDARDLFNALQNGSAQARELAQHLLRHAKDEVRAHVMRLAEADSAFKKRRSNKPNVY